MTMESAAPWARPRPKFSGPSFTVSKPSGRQKTILMLIFPNFAQDMRNLHIIIERSLSDVAHPASGRSMVIEHGTLLALTAQKDGINALLSVQVYTEVIMATIK